MKRLMGGVLSATLCLLAPDARAVTIDWTSVGDAGNANDTTGFGAVGYAYNIDKYDVTNSQYAEFLNTKDPTGANILGLWNLGMADATFGGISFNGGNLPGSRYVLTTGREGHPVNFVTWYDAIRFANWLNNGQGSGDTESGAYTLLGGTPTPSNGDSITRNTGATVFLPSEDEWYKAAYYDPRTTAAGGPPSDSHYWLYPTSSNTVPVASGPTALANHANYNQAVGNLTDVGAYTGTTSPYGAFDMAGNVFQWNEAFLILLNGDRGLRGGSYNPNEFNLQSSDRLFGSPTIKNFDGGFRVASVPEPSTLALSALGAVGLLLVARKRSRAHTNPTRQRGSAQLDCVHGPVGCRTSTRRTLAGASGWWNRRRAACAAIVLATLALFAADARAVTYAITDLGTVVGYSYMSGNAAIHAFLYSGGAMVDLNSLIDPSLGWVLTLAAGINDADQITGYGTIAGQTHAFLLTPVPEPSTFALSAVGAVGLLLVARKRSRAHTNPTRQRGSAQLDCVHGPVGRRTSTRRTLAGASGWWNRRRAACAAIVLAAPASECLALGRGAQVAGKSRWRRIFSRRN